MKYPFLSAVIALGLSIAPFRLLDAATCTTIAVDTWDCGTPDGSDDLIVNHDATIATNLNLTGSILVNAGTLTIDGDLTQELSSTITVNAGGTLTVNGNFNMQDDAVTVVFGTFNVAPNMEIKDNAYFTLKSFAVLDIANDFTIKSCASCGLTIEENGTVNVGNNFKTDADVLNDGVMAIDKNITINSTMTGSSTVTYGGNCNGSGIACLDPGWCDGSGSFSCNFLPVELTAFHAKANSSKVELTWTTETETGSDFFMVERSKDGKSYQHLCTVPAAGNAQEPRHYRCTDKQPLIGTAYYKLTQTDLDGSVNIQKFVSVSGLELTGKFIFFPNPPSGDFIQFNQRSNIVISNTIGETLMEAFDIRELDISTLPKGIYFIRNESYEVRRLVLR